MSGLSSDVQGRLRELALRYQGPARRPTFFLVLSGLLALATLGAFLARAGTPTMRALAAALVLVPVLVVLFLVLAGTRRRTNVVEGAVRATAAVDHAASTRLRRAARLVERLTDAPSGESVRLSEMHLDAVLAGVSIPEVERSARRRSRKLAWLAAGLLVVLFGVTWGRTLSIVEGLDVLLARSGVAPFAIPYIQESEIDAELPAHVGSSSRRIPILYEQAMLPTGSEITWRMIPRVGGRQFVVTDGVREAPFVSDGHGAWVARLRVDEPSELRVAAKFGDVKVLHDEILEVSTIPDRSPTVTLVGGPREISIAELDREPIEFIAQDDYGLSVVELVVESGQRKERQELARLDGNQRTYRAATAITRKTPLVKGAYQPIIVTIQARDADLVTGPHWGKSEAIVLLPEPIGEGLAQRHLALRAFRGALVEYLHAVEQARGESVPEGAKTLAAARVALERALGETEQRLEKAAEPPRGSLQFLRAQVASLLAPRASPARPEATLLATDVLLQELSRADAERLSKELGDVVGEVAARVHAAITTETGQSRTELLASIEAARQGASRLGEVGVSGLDLGSVASADLARARRLVDAGELSRAEAALLHLTARLRRATPSFGSKGAAVEAGSGSGSSGGHGSEPPLSREPSEYDKLGDAARALAEQHAAEQNELEQLLEEAARAAEADAGRDEELTELAHELRDAMSELPNYGRVPGSALAEASQARGQGEAMADALEAGQLDRALEAGRTTLEGLERARRANEAQGGYLAPGDLERAREAVQRAQGAAEDAKRRQPPPSLEERAQRQRELGRAARELAQRAETGSAPVPGELGEALRRAGELMDKAADALSQNQAARGKELSAEAQEELERALPERRQGDAESADPETESGDSNEPEAGHADVPGRSEDRSRDFRQRVESGLGREAGRFGPAVRRYAETLK